MSAESSGVFTLKEINRIKIIQDVISPRFLTSKPRGAISISMVNRWHCTAIKPVFFVLTINTPQAETGILSLGEPCMN